MFHVAIVDDNESWCFVLALRLQQHGFQVSTFTDPYRLLQEIQQFDLALVDFSMPPRSYQKGMDGPELICRARQQGVHSPLLVLISSFFTEDILQKASELCPEADAVLSKGMDSTQLIAQLEQLLNARKLPQKARAASSNFASEFERTSSSNKVLSEQNRYRKSAS